MRQCISLLLLFVVVAPALAESRVDIIADLEGAHRQTVDPVPGPVRYEPTFNNAGGIGLGVNWHLSDRLSIEGKVAALASKASVVIRGSDFVGRGDLGYAQIYPITLLLQWHPLDGVAVRPYVGAGVGHIILRNIEQSAAAPTVEFEDPTGVVLNMGIRVPISNKWSFNADARYIPIEARGGITFVGVVTSRADIDVRPLVIGIGVRYHY